MTTIIFWLADVLIVFPRGRALVTITRVKLKEQSKQKKTEDLPWTHDALFFNIILCQGCRSRGGGRGGHGPQVLPDQLTLIGMRQVGFTSVIISRLDFVS